MSQWDAISRSSQWKTDPLLSGASLGDAARNFSHNSWYFGANNSMEIPWKFGIYLVSNPVFSFSPCLAWMKKLPTWMETETGRKHTLAVVSCFCGFSARMEPWFPGQNIYGSVWKWRFYPFNHQMLGKSYHLTIGVVSFFFGKSSEKSSHWRHWRRSIPSIGCPSFGIAFSRCQYPKPAGPWRWGARKKTRWFHRANCMVLWWWSWSFSEKPMQNIAGVLQSFWTSNIDHIDVFFIDFQPVAFEIFEFPHFTMMAPDLCRIGWPSTTSGRPWGSGQEKPRSPWAAEATLRWHLFILYPPVMTNIAMTIYSGFSH